MESPVESLLPANASALLRALEQVEAERLQQLYADLRDLWNPDQCPARWLPFLAWTLSVDEWDPDWPEATKRQVIRDAYQLHSIKGSLASMHLALQSAGYGGAVIVEGDDDSWANYSVTLTDPIRVVDGPRVVNLLVKTAPLRSHLVALSFVAVQFSANGAIRADGTYSAGELANAQL